MPEYSCTRCGTSRGSNLPCVPFGADHLWQQPAPLMAPRCSVCGAAMVKIRGPINLGWTCLRVHASA